MKNENYDLTRVMLNSKKSFTAVFHKKVNDIFIDCELSPIEQLGKISSEKIMPVKAMWDSGASCSMVTQSMAKKLGLVSKGVKDSYCHGGFRSSNIYQVYIHLPNLIIVPIEVIESGDYPGFGLIIGMDILNKGDFSIKNSGPRTVVSFEMPEAERVDPSHTNSATVKPGIVKINGNKVLRTLLIEYDRIVNKIVIDCKISPCESSGQINSAKILQVKGLFDTGTVMSSVTKATAKRLGLISVMSVHPIDAKGKRTSNVYSVNVHLPNKEIIPVPVLESEDHPDFELIIGMDILSKGDLFIKNSGSRTVVSFEMLNSDSEVRIPGARFPS